ncbi:MAG: dihydroorotate dehydrogenase electron transfer subunit [Dehalococcoidia bacterium]|nr:dihydroorotate dehydrogenase electron transfer subunit [Dehalococcoidia bacterium]
MELMKQIASRIISCAETMPRTYLIWVHAPEIAAEACPGQFVTIRCGEGFEPLLRRPLSIHRIKDGNLALLFGVVGKGTEWLSRQSAGSSLDILGPLGNGFQIRKESKKLLMVAGGIGVAPLVALAERAIDEGLSVKLLLGARTSSHLYAEAIENVEIIQVTEDGSAGKKGMATDLLASLAPWADQIFACGPISMYRAMANMKADLGNKPVQVTLEQIMGCGVGACRGCAVPTVRGMKMVCNDGPVFDLREIVWEEMKEPFIDRLTRSI